MTEVKRWLLNYSIILAIVSLVMLGLLDAKAEGVKTVYRLIVYEKNGSVRVTADFSTMKKCEDTQALIVGSNTNCAAVKVAG